MASTTKVPLGGLTYQRKYYLDVNTNTYGSPTWTGVFGVSDFNYKWNQESEDGGDFDSSGWTSKDVTALGFEIEITLDRKTKAADATAYDVGQEALRAKALLLGDSNKVDIRWYEVTTSGPKVEAYRGYATVSWEPEGGDMKAKSKVKVVLTGRGAATAITHPDAAQAVPTVTSLSPAAGGIAGGTLVEIHGTGFFLAGVDDVVATTGITFGGHNATSWITESDNVIFAISPADDAGAQEVVITNSAGASTVNLNFVYS